ncbi:4-galactosyl-N-acetylglucosaminide 3-alpha-L-fucosyltransferase 9-like [Alosa pseudoharengus]|uniref:4-galactosyl-N-acetylglucosaminide 3-alpha-L-fucosyltransferase 9-like n=1 Tax=Alosa pseudoharengus TaxID=34774 RepID=UPI003F8A9C80
MDPQTPKRMTVLLLVLFLTCGLLTWLLNLTASRSPWFCPADGQDPPAAAEGDVVSGRRAQSEKPILLVWWWPMGISFDSADCLTHFGIDGCVITDDRSRFGAANAILFFHKSIARDLSNLPTALPRPPFQKWIWYNAESPTNTVKEAGLDSLFNLTLTYRRDSDITSRYELSIVRGQSEQFTLPRKDKLVCWILSNSMTGTGASTQLMYYHELRKHIRVTLYGKAAAGAIPLRDEDYYSTIGSCKFYLAFENSIHEDYITEKLNGPMVAGTVPVVLGTSRENYEQYVPADSFIHVNDFPDPKALAERLLELDRNDAEYRRYFAWRRHFKATPHLLVKRHMQPICTACDQIAKDNTFNVVHDLSWWFNGDVEGHHTAKNEF